MRISIRSALAVRATRADLIGKLTMDRMPSDPRTILSKCNLTGKTTVYAACPKCYFTYKPSYVHGSVLPVYPIFCTNKRHPDSAVCATRLVHEHTVKEDIIQTPIKPFVYHSVLDFVGALFSRGDFEEQIDNSCDEAFERAGKGPDRETDEIDDVLQGDFLRSFQGPFPERLFTDRRGEGRLTFSMNVDFFNVNGNRAGGPVTSCGIISMACLNLSPKVRYKFENLHIVGIIPGPREPDLETINNFLRPLIDDMVELWHPGVKLSRTASHAQGRVVRAILACVVCDLPAARKVAALANHRSDNFLCSLCKKTRANIDDPTDSPRRRPSEMRLSAEAWARTPTHAGREALFHSAGVRFSELWRLCYWDPTRQLVVDPMHNLLLGVAQDHFRNVLSLSSNRSAAAPTVQPAFRYEFAAVAARGSGGPGGGGEDLTNDKDAKDVSKIHQRLLLPLSVTERTVDESRQALAEQLANRHRYRALEFVCKSLGVSPVSPTNAGGSSRLCRIHWADALASWVSRLSGFEFLRSG